MFEPYLSFRNELVGLVGEIEVCRFAVENSKLESVYEQRLRDDALARKIYSLVRFAGCGLSLDDVIKIIKDDPGRDDRPDEVALRSGVVAKERDVRFAMNCLNVQKLITQTAFLAKKFHQESLTSKDLLAINALLGEKIVEHGLLSRWRNQMNNEMEIVHPLPVEVEFQINDLFAWFGSKGKKELHPILRAGVMLFEILRIAPFEVNNVLTGVLFFEAMLATYGYDLNGIAVIEDELFKNKTTLEGVLKKEIENQDMSDWLVYLTKELKEACVRAKNKTLGLSQSGLVFKSEKGKAIALSERQIVIMEELMLRGSLTIKEVRGMLAQVSDDTILRDIKDLMLKKLIRKKGKTKGAEYVVRK